jgi:hypothetical protein
VLRAIARRGPDIKASIVRLQVTISEPLEGLLHEGEIRKALQDAQFIAAVARNVERERRPRMAGWSAEAMTPLEALKSYLSTRKTATEPKALLEYGEMLIRASNGEQ